MSTDESSRQRADHPLRVVLIDDSAIFRQGLAALLTDAGLDVVGEIDSEDPLAAIMREHEPHAVVVDLRIKDNDEAGVRIAHTIRREWPTVGVLVFSTHYFPALARRLLSDGADGYGYLLKERVDDVRSLRDAITAVANGESAIDPKIVSDLLRASSRQPSALGDLSDRQREVLALMAEGRSNAGIGSQLHLSPRTVDAHIAQIFAKLPLRGGDHSVNRRVLAVLAYLHDRQWSS